MSPAAVTVINESNYGIASSYEVDTAHPQTTPVLSA